MKYVSLPTLSALQNEPVKYQSYFLKMLAVLSFLYMPIIVYICIYSHPIVYIALGSQWMDVVPIFRLLATSMFITPIVVLLGMMMLSFGHSRRYLFWGFCTSTSIVIAFVVGIQWGAIGIAASLPIATTANLIFSFFFVFKGSPVTIGATLNYVYRPAIASIVMGIILLLTYQFLSSFHVAAQIVLSILLGTVIYFAIWMLLPSGYKDIVEFISYPLSVMKRRKAIVTD